MKRTNEDASNDSHKKAKLDPTVTVTQNFKLNGHATNENGWSKVEKRKKKKANKNEVGKVEVCMFSEGVLGILCATVRSFSALMFVLFPT